MARTRLRRCRAGHRAALHFALEIGVAHDLLDDLIEFELLAFVGRFGTVQPREFQHLADQRVEPLDLVFHSIELARQLRHRLARESDGDPHAAQRRTQLVRNIAQQLGHRGAIGAQLVGHGVEVPRQHRDFVLAPFEPVLTTRIEVLRGERTRAFLDAPDRRA